MNVHESFTKKDLVDIIKENNFDIDINQTRHQIIQNLKKYNIEWLEEKNENERLSIKDKNKIILKSKKIISFVKNGCNIETSLYNNIKELLQEAREISEFGDIASVRRCIFMLNENLNYNIPCYVSDEILEEINLKKEIKEKSKPQIFFKTGKFKINF